MTISSKKLQWTVSLVLGVVFYLTQVVPALAGLFPCETRPSAPCAPSEAVSEDLALADHSDEEGNSCCEPTDCDCAIESAPADSQPAPIVPGTQLLPKPPPARLSSQSFWDDISPARELTLLPHAAPRDGPCPGYHGVDLMVAFCSFVI